MNEYSNSGVYTRNGDEFSFNFNTSLSASKRAAFINDVVGIVVNDNYYSFLTHIMFDYEIINEFTDVNVLAIMDSDNQIDAIDSFIKETNIVDIVKENAEPGLIESLYDSVDKCIEYKTGIHKNVIADEIANLIKIVEDKIATVNFEDMYKSVQKLSGISGELTADKLVEAYAKSDMLKSNQKVASTQTKKRNTKKNNLKVVNAESNK